MPGEVDGLRLAMWVRANKPGVEVIITTGLTRKTLQAGDLCAESSRADIRKPYDPSEVEPIAGGTSRKRRLEQR